jgi:hypothetical protein
MLRKYLIRKLQKQVRLLLDDSTVKSGFEDLILYVRYIPGNMIEEFSDSHGVEYKV